MPSTDVSATGRMDVFKVAFAALEANSPIVARDDAGFAGDDDSAPFVSIGASGDRRLDFAGLFNPDI